MASKGRREDSSKRDQITKPKWQKTIEYTGIAIGSIVFVVAVIILIGREYTFYTVKGTVTGKCKEGYIEGVEISFSVEGEEYTNCNSTEEAKALNLGDEVSLRILNGTTSFVWIESDEGKSGAAPQE